MKFDITNENIIPHVEILYFVTTRLMKVLIFSVIHLFLLVVLLFVLWYFEISAQDGIEFLKNQLQNPLWKLLAIFGASFSSIGFLYVKAYKAISIKISSMFVWKQALDSLDSYKKDKP